MGSTAVVEFVGYMDVSFQSSNTYDPREASSGRSTTTAYALLGLQALKPQKQFHRVQDIMSN